MENSYDVAIIGGGCAGLSAAMYAGRFGLKTVCLAQMPGGTITQTHLVENWPGDKSISGLELGNKLLVHAKQYSDVRMEVVEKVEKKEDSTFFVKTDSAQYDAKAVIFATGTEWKKLGLESEKRLASRGVHYCALCDGGFYKGKKIAVIGSGDSAVKESLLLAEFGTHVYILIRGDKLKGEPINNKRALENKKIEVISGVEVKDFLGKEKLEKLKLSRAVKVKGADSETDELEVSACFVLIGHVANSLLAKEVGVELSKKGEIMIDKMSKTNIEGVFGAGDCCDTAFKQAIVSASEGVSAAYSAFEWIKRGSR